MKSCLAILGRQPALGLAELESLFGAEKIRPLGQSATVEVEPNEFPFARLGGTVKAAKILETLPYNDWHSISDYLVENIPKIVNKLDDGKLTLGISTYGFETNTKAIQITGLEIKKAVKSSGRPVRVVPTNGTELNSAQVIHNKLTDAKSGLELVLAKDGNQTILAQTFQVQDIEAYAARDQARPKRDARVGMLPPKLAQIMVNIAVTDAYPHYGPILLDPFCGTGVILQEAQLMGFDSYGTDIEPRMIEYSQENLSWLHHTHRVPTNYFRLEVGDATKYEWQVSSSIKFIASETYLGRPFSAPPKPEVLNEVMRDVDTIHKKFMKNVYGQTKPGFRMCIAVPAWKSGSGFKHLKTLDSLEELGYTRVSFVHVRNEDLIYHRPDQIVGRELVVLKRK